MAITDVLGATSLFRGLRQPELEVLAQRMRQRRYREGEAIFHRDDPGAAMYLILDGRVKIHNEGADGTDVIITVIKSGDFFGELACLDGSERSADATTLEPTEMLMLTRGDLEVAIERSPRIAMNMMACLATRLRGSTNSIEMHSALDVKGRVARVLLDLAEKHGETVNGGTRISAKLTQSELAALVGASRESVNKELGKFRRRGCLEYDEDKQHLILLKPAELRKHCE
jgi:CRP/FNR family transcriptional regulator/CRP/FNR family cyclic AMP-dependent transcriptional regulator